MREVQKTVYQSDDGREYPLTHEGMLSALNRDRVCAYNALLKPIQYEGVRKAVTGFHDVMANARCFSVGDIDRMIWMLQCQREITVRIGDE